MIYDLHRYSSAFYCRDPRKKA